MEWTPLVTEDGSVTLVSTTVGQACHSRSGAWLEARERYAIPTRLRERALALSGDDRMLRLLDVGTGLGLTIAAALDALEGTGVRLDVVTLERDTSVLTAAARIGREAIRGGAAPTADLDRSWALVLDTLARALAAGPDPASEPLGADRGRLRLLLGDGRETIQRLPARPTFDAVFLDPFSPAADPPLWEREFLAAVAVRMAPGSWLSTYCASLEVRARLVLAGLRVGPGGMVGAKREGTLASPDLDPGAFQPRVARKLARRVERIQSRAPVPGNRCSS
ncbi:MAG: hypothetical protein E2O39_00460 [Planctomycetota bacterium]|nr:MAG: hypothetical protein E2O39_00460 [Planctomycetota bacterium]